MAVKLGWKCKINDNSSLLSSLMLLKTIYRRKKEILMNQIILCKCDVRTSPLKIIVDFGPNLNFFVQQSLSNCNSLKAWTNLSCHTIHSAMDDVRRGRE